jgi:hypothetical protein
MKNNITNMLRLGTGFTLGTLLLLCVANAQSPSPSPSPTAKAETKKAAPAEEVTSAQTGEDAGKYTITSSIEVGVRGMRVTGDHDKYQSDLNYNAGVRLFDGSFLMQAKDGKGQLFDTFLMTSSGWGADPQGQMRISIEKSKWYRFDGSYRNFKYFRYLNNIVNPNWLFTGFPVPPNKESGLHNYNTRTALGDFDLTILPKNEKIRFNIGYSPERYSGPFFSSYHIGGNEFQLRSYAKTKANDFRFGADGKIGAVDWTFTQGFRRFRDDSFVEAAAFINPNPTNIARFTSFNRNEPTRGSVDYTRASIHSLLAKKFDITGRFIYSNATANSTFLENMTGTNFATRIGSGAGAQIAPPNVLLLGQYVIPANAKRPNTLGDVGITFLATDKFRISNTFQVEDFTIDGAATFNDIFSVSRGAVIDTRIFTNLSVAKSTKYRKYQDTAEGDYQFNKNYSIHFGYRYGSRRIEESLSGFALNTNAPVLLVPEAEVETNHTNAFFAGFKARPAKNWTIYFDGEHGSADNVFTRIGNYNYTNIRAKTRWAPDKRVNFNLSVITKDNANPSEIAGVSLSDFGVNVKSRIFTSSVSWIATPKLSISSGYNYTWLNSDAIVDYFYQVPPAASVRHPNGHSLYFVRNNFYYVDVVGEISRRATVYASYRINQDNGQGARLADPTGTPGTLVSSYPMAFQSPEARVAFKLNRHLDWNVGYQYYNYNESNLVAPRAQNYHAHLPYTSLRVYFGRRE